MKQTQRIPIGIEGMDTLLGGGFPVNTVNLVSGPPGSGKSLLCMHFIYSGIENFDEPGLYITLEENRDGLVRAMKSFGMKPEIYEEEGELVLADVGFFARELGPARDAPAGLAGMDILRQKGTAQKMNMDWLRADSNAHDELERGIIGFKTLTEVVENTIQKKKIKRLVVDSVVAIGLMYGSPDTFRKELFAFGRFLRQKKITSLLVTESSGVTNAVRFGVEHFITDSHISFNMRNIKGEFLRTVNIQKMRFGNHDSGVHPFVISSRGLEVNTREFVRL